KLERQDFRSAWNQGSLHIKHPYAVCFVGALNDKRPGQCQSTAGPFSAQSKPDLEASPCQRHISISSPFVASFKHRLCCSDLCAATSIVSPMPAIKSAAPPINTAVMKTTTTVFTARSFHVESDHGGNGSLE